MTHILVAEDEKRIADFLVTGLRSSGYRVSLARTGPVALRMATEDDIDLVVLDIGLPGMDGLTVLRSLRAAGSLVPVLILTAHDGVADTVAGLDGGADDYMTKPFSLAELRARIRRRLAAATLLRPTTAGPDWLAVDDLVLDVRGRRIEVGGRWVDLSPREVDLLQVLFQAPGEVLSREELLSRAWGTEHDPGTNVVDVYVGYLRRKLDNRRIETIRGRGYRLRGQPR
jgi:DNA-binding response OmpR family regulator